MTVKNSLKQLPTGAYIKNSSARLAASPNKPFLQTRGFFRERLLIAGLPVLIPYEVYQGDLDGGTL